MRNDKHIEQSDVKMIYMVGASSFCMHETEYFDITIITFILPLILSPSKEKPRRAARGRNKPRSLPDGTHLITIPIVELESLVDGEKEKNSALYQKVRRSSLSY